MESITVREILDAVGGELLGSFDMLGAAVSSVDTDSRAMQANALFIPLAGENFDGHNYIEQALEQASGTLTAHTLEQYRADRFYILVKDTMKALGDLAAYYRSKFQIKVVAVTGSVGKTTTKDMIASVLREKFSILKTEGNFNNNIGVPKTLFRLTSRDQIAVVEMGMNHLGEIDYLTKIVRPDVAVITNVGDAHIENLGCRENTLRAKCEIFNGMKDSGVAVLNGDDALLITLDGKLKQQILWYGNGENCTFRCAKLDEKFDDHMEMQIKAPQDNWKQFIPGLGAYMVYPVLTAAAVGSWFGMETEEIRRGVMNFIPTKMRMDILRRRDRITILNDTYNANPQSMRAAVDVLSKFRGEYKIAVLGDMLELGDLGAVLHEGVGQYVARCGIDCLIAVGSLAKHFCDGAAEGSTVCYTCANRDQAEEKLVELLRPGCTVLCKASRGMKLEKVVEFLKTITEADE